jgi:hypothetical protein
MPDAVPSRNAAKASSFAKSNSSNPSASHPAFRQDERIGFPPKAFSQRNACPSSMIWHIPLALEIAIASDWLLLRVEEIRTRFSVCADWNHIVRPR